MKIRPWWAFFGLCAAVSLILFAIRKPLGHWSLGVYVFSLALSFLFWLILGLIDKALRSRPLRLAFALVVGLFFTTLLAASLIIHLAFRSFITGDLLRIIVDYPHYLWNYVQTFLLNLNGVVFLGFAAIFSYLWYRPQWRQSVRWRWRSFLALVIAIVLLAAGVLNIHRFSATMLMTLDASFFSAIENNMRRLKRDILYTSHSRLSVAPSILASPDNIVFIVNESLSPEGLAAFGYDGRAMPFLSAWYEREKANFFIFDNFYTNSGATELSVPSIMTGVGPEEGSNKLHTLPLLWDWARAADHATLFVSSFQYNWSELDAFLLNRGPDFHATGESMDLPIVHDLGVDDLGAVDYLRQGLDRIPPGKPFVAVYNSNAMHEPYQDHSRYVKVPPDLTSRHDKALFILDKTFEKIYSFLEDRRLLDRTIFVFTSDHGSVPWGKGLPRVLSFYREVVQIPLMIRAPASWLREYPAFVESLRANKSSLASNLDILPTLITFLGLEADNAALLAQIRGRSLCRPLPQRYVIILNTNEFRKSQQEGFGIYWNDRSFIYSTVQGPRYFVLSRDSIQGHDTWPDLSPQEQEQVMSIVRSIPQLNRIFNKKRT